MSRNLPPANNNQGKAVAKVPPIFGALDRRAQEFKLALPKGMDVGQFIRDVKTALRQNPTLLECSPETILGGAMTAAQAGLRFGPWHHVCLVPFRNKSGKMDAQLIFEYRGLLELAARAGLKNIQADYVRKGDHFKVAKGSNFVLEHIPEMHEGMSRLPEIWAYYCYVEASTGPDVKILLKKDAEEHRDKFARSKNGPWSTDFHAMALKTVVRMALSMVPKTPELSLVTASDEMVNRISPEAESEITVEAEDVDTVDAEPESEVPA